MFLQEKRSAFELDWAPGVTWGDVYRENERQWSAYNFEEAPVDVLRGRFDEHEEECRHLVTRRLPLPAYDQVLKCSHVFNLLDARGAISVTERAAYIARVRGLARRALPSFTSRWRRMATLLLEIGCEELPASACIQASAQLRDAAQRVLGAMPAQVLAGPRRLAVVVTDLPDRTADEWVKGPPVSAGERAAASFAKKQGVAVEELTEREASSG